MIPVPDEMLMAYADGELTFEEEQALEQLLRQDPVLRARLEPFVATRTRLAYAFDQILHDPVPDRLVAAIAVAAARPQLRAQSVGPNLAERIRDAVMNVFAATVPSGLSPYAAVASLLFVGGVAGWTTGRFFEPAAMVAVRDGGLIASGTLAKALETLPSGGGTAAGSGGSTVTPVLSFRSRADGICREYRISSEPLAPDYAGLACRGTDGTWHINLQTETPKAAADRGSYQTATGENVPAVDALTESLISGDAFGRDDEAALLARGWLSPEIRGTVPGAPRR